MVQYNSIDLSERERERTEREERKERERERSPKSRRMLTDLDYY